MWRNKILLGLMLLTSGNVLASSMVKQVIHEGPVEVRAEIGKAIEVVVEGGVSNLVRSGDAASLKVEHVSGHLFITPLLRPAAELVVMDAIGRSFRFKFIFDQGLDERVVIAARVNEDLSRARGISSIDFIRALASGRTPEGAVELDQKSVIFQDARVRITVVRMFEMPAMVGYVLSVENLLLQSLVVPVEQFNFPGLLAVTAPQDILSPAGKPGGQGIIYMVSSR